MTNQSIVKNYILNTISQVLNLIVPVVTMPYIARVLGAEKLGLYSYSNAVVMFFSLFAVLGTTIYGQQVIAQIRDDVEKRSKTFWEIEVLSIFTTVLSVVGWLILVCCQRENKLIFLILTVELIAVALDISWFYNGLEKFVCIVVPNIIVKLISTVAMFILVKEESDLWKYIFILVVGKLVGNATMWIMLPGYVVRIKIKALNIRPHLKETIIYFVPTIAASVYSYLDKVMIQFYADTDAENGYYDQANRIINIAYTVIISINTVMASRMAYLFSNKKNDEIKEKLENAVAFIFTIGMPCCFGISALAGNFVPWFWGGGFNKVILLLRIASPLVLLLSLHNLLAAQYLVPSGQRARSTLGVFLGAVVNFGCNLLLVPCLYSIGAVIGTIISEITICCVYLWMSKDFVPLKLLIKYVPKQMVASIIMYCFINKISEICESGPVLTIVQAFSGIVIYCVILIIFKERFVLKMSKNICKKVRIVLTSSRRHQNEK